MVGESMWSTQPASEQRKETLQKSKLEAQRRKSGEGGGIELTLLGVQRNNATMRLSDAGLCRMLSVAASKSGRLPKVGGC
jgi:hypothetical protein